MKHYDWMEATHTCEKCGWIGHGREAKMGDWFEYGAEYLCPACSEKISFVSYSTIDDNLTDPRADPADRMVGKIIQSRSDRFEQAKLTEASQLPDLDPVPEVLYWDVIEESDSESYVVILNGQDEIWRELSWFENYIRFGEVADILREKYGDKFRDLIPMKGSMLDLYGDSIRAVSSVAEVREELRNRK